jgi:hypothetical protein
MKKTLFVLFALFTIGVANAQDSAPQQEKNKTQVTNRVHQVDHLLFITGKVYLSQQGQLTAIDKQIRLENGLLVNPDGTYQKENQKHRHLRDGECLDMSGNRYLTLADFNDNRMIRVREKTPKTK